MECMFHQLDPKNCLIQQRCEGIYQIMLEFGTSFQFAKDFSRYSWRRSLLSKFEDKKDDPVHTFSGLLNKALAKIFFPIFKIWNRDIFRIETLIRREEEVVRVIEQTHDFLDPMEYFEAVGKGYGIFFKYAAHFAQCSSKKIQNFEQLGQDIGCFVALRDSYIDLNRDRKNHAFNPFLEWESPDIRHYYITHKRDLTRNILQTKTMLERSNGSKNPNILPETTKSLTSVKNYLQKVNSCSHHCKTALNTANDAIQKIPLWIRVLSAVLCFLPNLFPLGAAQISTLIPLANECCCCYWVEPLNCQCGCCRNPCEGCCDQCCSNCCQNCQCNCGNCGDNCCDGCQCDCNC